MILVFILFIFLVSVKLYNPAAVTYKARDCNRRNGSIS